MTSSVFGMATFNRYNINCMSFKLYNNDESLLVSHHLMVTSLRMSHRISHIRPAQKPSRDTHTHLYLSRFLINFFMTFSSFYRGSKLKCFSGVNYGTPTFLLFGPIRKHGTINQPKGIFNRPVLLTLFLEGHLDLVYL